MQTSLSKLGKFVGKIGESCIFWYDGWMLVGTVWTEAFLSKELGTRPKQDSGMADKHSWISHLNDQWVGELYEVCHNQGDQQQLHHHWECDFWM